MNTASSTFTRKTARTALIGLLISSLPAFSQSCALCYTQAAQSTTRFIQALRSGILILIIPPMFMSVGFTVMAYRKRNRYHSERSERNNGW